MLEPILQGLIEWSYLLFKAMADYFFGDLINVLTMNMDYFRKVVPVVDNISAVILALGWALLLGNLAFQSIKSMTSGAGFDGEDPRLLFLRTFAFSFLLLASRQICDMCSSVTGRVVAFLGIQNNFTIYTPPASMFSTAGSVKWLIAIIVGVVLIVQMLRLFFDIGERYVIFCVLTFMAPLAFAMGASKNTSDIFKGWCRMYGSMNLMLIMNIIYLKLIAEAMLNVGRTGIVLWVVFVLALTRAARKTDAHIVRIGLNPAQTSNSVGLRVPGGMTLIVIRTIASLIGKNVSGMKGGSGKGYHTNGYHQHNFHNGPNYSRRSTNTTTNTATVEQNATQGGDTKVRVSVPNQGRGGSVNPRGSRTADRQSRNAANGGSRYGMQSSSDRRTDASRETIDTENNRRGIKPNYIQSVNTGYVQSPAPVHGANGRVIARQSVADRAIQTKGTERSATYNSSDRSEQNPRVAHPPLSRYTGTSGAASAFSVRSNVHSVSTTRADSASHLRKADTTPSDTGRGHAHIPAPIPSEANVQGRSRISGQLVEQRNTKYVHTAGRHKRGEEDGATTKPEQRSTESKSRGSGRGGHR